MKVILIIIVSFFVYLLNIRNSDKQKNELVYVTINCDLRQSGWCGIVFDNARPLVNKIDSSTCFLDKNGFASVKKPILYDKLNQRYRFILKGDTLKIGNVIELDKPCILSTNIIGMFQFKVLTIYIGSKNDIMNSSLESESFRVWEDSLMNYCKHLRK